MQDLNVLIERAIDDCLLGNLDPLDAVLATGHPLNDGLIVFPSETEWLEESKGVGAHGGLDAAARRLGARSSLRRMKSKLRLPGQYQREEGKYGDAIEAIVNAFDADKIDKREAKKRFKEAAEKAFRKAYAIGLVASGVGYKPIHHVSGTKGDARNKARLARIREVEQNLSSSDNVYLSNAVREEVRFFSKYLAFIEDNGPRPGRTKGYKQSLLGLYGAGRVAGIPGDTLIWWSGPRDADKCESCVYLMRNGPYTKNTLPTTPRAGDTLCLFNCRDTLVAKKSTTEDVSRARARGTRQEHLEALRQIKRKRGR